MFNDYQFPGTAFHAMQWPGVGITSEEAVIASSAFQTSLSLGF